MEEDKNASIILGRPFLAICRALIDGQEVALNVLEALQHPNDFEGCMRVNLIEPLIKEVFEAEVLDDILDSPSEDDLLEIDDSLPQKEKPHMPSTKEGPPKFELKPLPSSLKYAFLSKYDTYLVIISSSLRHDEEYALLQITVDPQDQENMAFTCPFGVFANRKMPFRLCNAPVTFQKCMLSIFSNMVENFIEISSKGIEVDKAKVEVIKKLPPPTNVKLVYGKACHLPVELEHREYWETKFLNFDAKAAGEKWLLQLNELDEFRNSAYENAKLYKEKTKL
nr:uncharacterized protein LOC112757327 [Arachis hypogaea]